MSRAKTAKARTWKPRWALWVASGVVPLLTFVLLVWWWPRSDESPRAQVPQTYSEEALRWQSARQAGTSDALQAFLDAYPHGQYHDSAQALLDSLQARSAAPIGTEAPAATESAADQVPRTPAMAPRDTRSSTQAAALPAGPSVLSTQGKHDTLAQAANPSADGLPALPPKPVAPPPTGKVLLRVIPWGAVSVNQRPVGTTPPLTQLDLPEGQHRIEISNPAASTVVRTVQVKKGEPVTLSLKFE